MSLERVTQSHENVRFLEINFPILSWKIHQTIEAYSLFERKIHLSFSSFTCAFI